MGKSVHNDVLDAALDLLRTEGAKLHVCNAEPTTYDEANNQPDHGTPGYNLANSADIDSALDAAVISDGTSGRKLAIPEVVIASIGYTGDATHLAISDGVSKLLYVSTCTTQSLTSGNPLTVPTWNATIYDPQ